MPIPPLPPPPPPGGGFLQRFGGPLGVYQYLAQINAGGYGGTAVATQLISAVQQGQIPLVPTQMQLGQMLSAYGATGGAGLSAADAAAGGEGGSGGGGSAAACAEGEPGTTAISGDVQARIDRYEARVRADTAPLGTPIDPSTWLELQSLSFKTPQGIRLARQLLWYVKALFKARMGKESTKVRYNNHVVDLLDRSVEPSSADEINATVPLYGEHIAARESNSPELVVGSPFTSDETWAAIKTMRRVLRGHEPSCTKAKGVPGDEWAMFKYFVEGSRGYGRVLIDGQSFDFLRAYRAARGASASAVRPSTGGDLTRFMFHTIEDRRITVEDRVAPRAVQSDTIGSALGEAAAADKNGGPTAQRPIQSEIRRGQTSSEDGDIRITQGPEMYISAEMEKLFERFFDLPPFRFDMPLRTEEDYSGLIRSYTERYVRLNRGATQDAQSVRRLVATSTNGEGRTGIVSTAAVYSPSTYSVSIPALLPPSSGFGVEKGESTAPETIDQASDIESRINALMEALDVLPDG